MRRLLKRRREKPAEDLNPSQLSERWNNSINIGDHFLRAVQTGAIDVLRELNKVAPEQIRSLINTDGTTGMSPLAIAVQSNQGRVVLWLLKYGAYIGWHDKYTGVPLIQLAASKGALKSLKALKKHEPDFIKKGINDDAALYESFKITPIGTACLWGRSEVVSWLLDNGAKLKYSQDLDNETLLHMAMREICFDTTKVLEVLKTKAPRYFRRALKVKNARGWIPLMTALNNNNSRKYVTWLIENNCITGTKDELNVLAEYFSRKFRDIKIFKNDDKFSRYFNLMLQVLTQVELVLAKMEDIPLIFKCVREMAGAYMILHYMDQSSHKLHLLAIGEVLSWRGEEFFPRNRLSTSLGDYQNVLWKRYVAAVAGVTTQGNNVEAIRALIECKLSEEVVRAPSRPTATESNRTMTSVSRSTASFRYSQSSSATGNEQQPDAAAQVRKSSKTWRQTPTP